VVARAAGISAWQFLQPGLLVALSLGIVTVTIYNPLSASLKEQGSKLESRIFSHKAKGSGPELWIRQKSLDGQAVIRADAAVVNTTLTNVAAFVFDKEGHFQERVESTSATLQEGFWEFRNARVFTTIEEPQSYATYLLASNLTANQVRQSFTPAESVPFWRLGDTIVRSESAGLDATRYRLQYDVLLARPLLFVAMVFVAASVSLRFFRFGGVAKMVISGVTAGFVLYVVTELMRDLGTSGFVGPTVAAWFPAVVGSLLGTLALLYQEDG
jgi:lipopolysaccharide export system permease protein